MTISNSTLLGTQCATSRDLNLTLKKSLFLGNQQGRKSSSLEIMKALWKTTQRRSSRQIKTTRILVRTHGATHGRHEISSLERTFALELDVTSNGATIEVAVQRAWNAFGLIDTLINNADIRGNVSFSLELSEEEWEHIFKTNLRGA
ncbi:hypothetical protein MTR67_001020 [Solanum verrucosum]|uniref:Uncharacterized protein n=1 Tax=Solanum verrucosum TaxID=315347 RepID=A0AAF0PR22_SOLVR|nr:hypothetical protein MTR67_001020 [Solanum verrucosum]